MRIFKDGRMVIAVGARPSPLSLKQVEEVKNMLSAVYGDERHFEFEIKTFDTTGDVDKKTPISEVEGTDFFTDTLEKKLRDKEIDMVVHSAKDLPDMVPAGLLIAAITGSIAPEDVLVSKNNLKLSELPSGAKVGTSSQRRKEQLKKLRPDLDAVNLRGNIEERLTRLNDGLDAIIIARAALIRLGLEEKITEILPSDIFPPHPLQGALAIQIRYGDSDLLSLFSKLDVRKKILFVCVENSCRSQIAEALVNHFYWQKFFAESAGSKPSGLVNPLAIEVMKDRGVDISGQISKGFTEIRDREFDYVITMGCGDVCPVYPAKKKLDWKIPDPKNKPLDFFRLVRDDIESKIRKDLYEDSKGE